LLVEVNLYLSSVSEDIVARAYKKFRYFEGGLPHDELKTFKDFIKRNFLYETTHLGVERIRDEKRRIKRVTVN